MRLRELKKQESRARVLDAARALFDEVGFEGTTVRMIAKRAGVSLGGVFTTFESKADILVAIVAERRAAAIEAMAGRTAELGKTTLERIHALCCIGRQDAFANPRLGIAYLGAAFGWSERTEAANVALQARMGEIVIALLTDGIAADEIREDLDVPLLRRMILAMMISNFRTAYYGGWSVEQADAVFYRELELMFDGARPRALISA